MNSERRNSNSSHSAEQTTVLKSESQYLAAQARLARTGISRKCQDVLDWTRRHPFITAAGVFATVFTVYRLRASRAPSQSPVTAPEVHSKPFKSYNTESNVLPSLLSTVVLQLAKTWLEEYEIHALANNSKQGISIKGTDSAKAGSAEKINSV